MEKVTEEKLTFYSENGLLLQNVHEREHREYLCKKMTLLLHLLPTDSGTGEGENVIIY